MHKRINYNHFIGKYKCFDQGALTVWGMKRKKALTMADRTKQRYDLNYITAVFNQDWLHLREITTPKELDTIMFKVSCYNNFSVI